MEAYTQFEMARIESCLENIKRSVSRNTSLNENEKQEILLLTERLYSAEMDFLVRNPEDYYGLYANG